MQAPGLRGRSAPGLQTLSLDRASASKPWAVSSRYDNGMALPLPTCQVMTFIFRTTSCAACTGNARAAADKKRLTGHVTRIARKKKQYSARNVVRRPDAFNEDAVDDSLAL